MASVERETGGFRQLVIMSPTIILASESTTTECFELLGCCAARGRFRGRSSSDQ